MDCQHWAVLYLSAKNAMVKQKHFYFAFETKPIFFGRFANLTIILKNLQGKFITLIALKGLYNLPHTLHGLRYWFVVQMY